VWVRCVELAPEARASGSARPIRSPHTEGKPCPMTTEFGDEQYNFNGFLLKFGVSFPIKKWGSTWATGCPKKPREHAQVPTSPACAHRRPRAGAIRHIAGDRLCARAVVEAKPVDFTLPRRTQACSRASAFLVGSALSANGRRRRFPLLSMRRLLTDPLHPPTPPNPIPPHPAALS